MLVQDDPEIATIPGSAGGGVQTFSNAAGRVLVFDESLSFDLWPASGPLVVDAILTATYDPVLSRVRLVGTLLGGFAAVTFERSTNGVQWTTVRGGVSVPVAGGTAKADDFEFAPNVVNRYRMRTLAPITDTVYATITPTLTDVWLKSVARPFLNLAVALLGNTFAYERADRGARFTIVGRSLPVAVTDVRGPRQYTIKVRTDTDDAASDLDLLLAGGDTLYLHAPPGSVVPAGGVFVAAGRVLVETPAPPAPLRFTSIELTECAASAADVVGATSTCQTVLNTYPTCADVLAAHATCSSLLELIGDPSEVIVP